jgi:hypothetical protein
MAKENNKNQITEIEKNKITAGIEELPEINGHQFHYLVKSTRTKKEIADLIIKPAGNPIKPNSLNAYYLFKDRQIPAHLKLIIMNVIGEKTINYLLTEYIKESVNKKGKK